MSSRVLIVDPVFQYRAAVVGHLKRVGMDVCDAGNAAEARAELTNEGSGQFDLALVDNELPDLAGIELVQELLSEARARSCILVVKPSFAKKDNPIFAPEGGATVLVGPVPPIELGRLVEEFFQEDATLTQAGSTPAASRTEPSSLPGVPAPSADEQMLAVRRSYQAKLPQELEELRRLVDQVRSQNGPVGQIEEAHKIAHTLHGTAGTLGFPEVSEAAMRIEESLKPLVRGVTDAKVDWQRVDVALDKALSAPERPSLLVEVESPLGSMSSIGTVLVVDDDEHMLTAMESIGRTRLINVATATSGQRALELASSDDNKFDGAIIELNMGEEGEAFEIARRLRLLEGLSEFPVAFMCSDPTVADRVAAAHAGASQFLQKPINPEELAETVRIFVATTRSREARILLVDDDSHFRDHISALLEAEGMDVTSLGDPGKVLEVMRNTVPDILLLDVTMPGVTGFDVCRMLRSTAAWKEIPILFLTAETDADSRVECFRAGGDDYIEKPVVREELVARIGVRMERIQLFQDRADRDALTGLPNRRAFLDLFSLRLADGQRYDRPVSLCVIDLDKFKDVNDTHGHLSGDRVLVGLGKLLSARFRTVDVRARWGGEEFVVAFYGEEAATSREILTRVLEEFRKMVFEGDQGEEFTSTFSAGIATMPADGTTFQDIFRAADARLYTAKEKGRNRIET